MQNSPALEITQLYKTYKTGTSALNNVNLQIQQGDFFGLLGANGAGKTTLIGIITGLVNRTSGNIKVHGIDTEKSPNQAKKLIGVVPQEFNFGMFEKVQDIIINQAGFYGIPRAEALPQTEKLLKALELYDKRHQPARTLSGGMKRRLMIARALVHQPKFLILDEPTAGVDVELRKGMWEYLKALNENGTTILLTTHYLEEAEELCNNIAIIKTGEIIKADSKHNLLESLEEESYYISTKNLAQEFQHKRLKKLDNTTLELTVYKNETLNQFLQELTEQSVEIVGIRPKGNRLEQLFLNFIYS